MKQFDYNDAKRMHAVRHNGVVAMRYLYNAMGERVHRAGSLYKFGNYPASVPRSSALVASSQSTNTCAAGRRRRCEGWTTK